LSSDEYSGVVDKILKLYNSGAIDLSGVENGADAINVLLTLYDSLNGGNLESFIALIKEAQAEGFTLLDILLEIESRGNPVAAINKPAEAYSNFQTATNKFDAGDIDAEEYIAELDEIIGRSEEMIEKDAEHSENWLIIRDHVAQTRAELQEYKDLSLDATDGLVSSVSSMSDAFAE